MPKIKDYVVIHQHDNPNIIEHHGFIQKIQKQIGYYGEDARYYILIKGKNEIQFWKKDGDFFISKEVYNTPIGRYLYECNN